MTLTAATLAPIAAKLRMPPSALIALPTAVEAFARKTGMSEASMAAELMVNEPLRDYLATVCIQAAAT